MKNEAKYSDMLDIMLKMQEYPGKNYPPERRVASGGDQLTCERQGWCTTAHDGWRHPRRSTTTSRTPD